MQCRNCGTENPAGTKFCGECGTPLQRRCTQCGTENPPQFKFCGECGASLVVSSQSSVVSSQPLTSNSQFLDSGLRTLRLGSGQASDPGRWTPPHLAERIRAATITDGERKTITALFADLKGSTALIEGLDPEEARAIIDPALQLMMDAVHRYEGYVAQALGASLLYLGELRQGREQLEQGIALYDIHRHRSHAFLYGVDPGVYCLCFAAWTLWCLGYPEQALKNAQDALHLVHELAHPHTLAFALNLTAMFHQFRHEETAVREQADSLLTLSIEHEFAYRAAVATIMRGWVLAAADQTEEGVVQMQEGLAAQRATGSESVAPYFLALQAEIYGKMGQPKEGLVALAEASVLMQKTGEQWYEAEVYRLKGELTLQQESQEHGAGSQEQGAGSREQETEACFLKAIDIARKQQAKSLELRATMSLARLWQQQGKLADAHQMLVEIYNWFTKGFDTKDLQEAKTLLEELQYAVRKDEEV